MSSEGPASLPASEPSDPAGFHRRLAHWNHRRLAPATPGRAWRDDVRYDAEMMLVEGDFIERARVEAAPWLADLPATADGFVAWFEALKGSGPGEADPLFPWLAETASMEEMRWFLLQEVAGEAGFEDLVAMAQVKMPTRPKLELARNYWDEMGRGSEAGMHGPMLDRLATALDLHPRIEETAWPSLALGNTLVAFSTQRRYAYHALGALGAVELTAPWRAAHVAEGLKRLGVGVERKYFALHATLDIAHSEAWNEEVLRPLAQERPECVRALAEGAIMRLMAGARCFDAYRAHLWGQAPLRRSA
ncbi:iron-containing redox enzyme family protein [Brevundimonas sp. M1A4_2e]|nr:iron-containing redox enzyme family protein [Brevundimonas naejangsanensis]